MSEPDGRSSHVSSPTGARSARFWLTISLAIFAVLLMPCYFGVKHLLASRTTQPLTQNSTAIASFTADFQLSQPKAGWHYYWNARGAVGDTNAYEELHWNGGKNYVAGDAEHPAPRSDRKSTRLNPRPTA